MFTVESYAPPELRSARIAFNFLKSSSHIKVSGCDVPNTRRVLRHTSLRVASACRRSASVDFGSLDMVSALFLRMERALFLARQSRRESRRARTNLGDDEEQPKFRDDEALPY